MKTLDEAGFTDISVDLLPSTNEGPRAADTLLIRAVSIPRTRGRNRS
ncbi:hypothetical protein OG194_26650 [Streptomyces sp. NBC_01288]|nr:hypothetical protein OG194_26650 [Streptomyces sp. NBC_01288]